MATELHQSPRTSSIRATSTLVFRPLAKAWLQNMEPPAMIITGWSWIYMKVMTCAYWPPIV